MGKCVFTYGYLKRCNLHRKVRSAGLPCDSNAPVGISDPSIISDGQMNASSQHDSPRYKPYYGRLHDKRGDGWCPSPTAEGNDSLQIDLRDTFVVCAVATQGNRDGKTLTTAFKLSYSSDGKNWTFYKYGDCSEKVSYCLPLRTHSPRSPSLLTSRVARMSVFIFLRIVYLFFFFS